MCCVLRSVFSVIKTPLHISKGSFPLFCDNEVLCYFLSKLKYKAFALLKPHLMVFQAKIFIQITCSVWQLHTHRSCYSQMCHIQIYTHLHSLCLEPPCISRTKPYSAEQQRFKPCRNHLWERIDQCYLFSIGIILFGLVGVCMKICRSGIAEFSCVICKISLFLPIAHQPNFFRLLVLTNTYIFAIIYTQYLNLVVTFRSHSGRAEKQSELWFDSLRRIQYTTFLSQIFAIALFYLVAVISVTLQIRTWK